MRGVMAIAVPRGGRAACSFVSGGTSSAKVEGVEPPVQRATADPENASRCRSVAADLLQCAFDLLARELDIVRRRRRSCGNRERRRWTGGRRLVSAQRGENPFGSKVLPK